VIVITILFAADVVTFLIMLRIVLVTTIDPVPLFSVAGSGPTVVPLSGDWLIGVRPGMSPGFRPGAQGRRQERGSLRG